MVDNAEITVSGKDDIRIKDYLGYIQDDIDLSSLMGLWNFAGSVRDESGNQLNEENAYNNFAIKGGLTYPAQTSSSRVLGKRSMDYDSKEAGRFLKIPDKKTKNANGTDSTYSIVDWSNDFTLAFYVKLAPMTGTVTSVAEQAVLFDKMVNSAGNGKGITVRMYRPQNSATTVRQLQVLIGDGTNTPATYTHVMTDTDWDDLDKHICITRTDGVVKVYVEDTEVISQTFAGDLTNTADIYLGKEFNTLAGTLVESTANHGGMSGTYHQMRLYSRTWSTTEITKWVGLNAPSISLKFYGRIWRIDERNASNRCYLKGLGSVALNSRIDSSILSNDVANLRDKNIYQTGSKFSDIVQDMLKVINERFFGTSNSDIMMLNYQALQKAVGEGYTLKAPFIAEGSFLDILNDLSVLDAITFTFMPTGILQIEKNNALLQRGGLILSNNNCKISDGGVDDSNLCNHLYAAGNIKTFNAKITGLNRSHGTANSWGSSFGRFSASGSSPDVFPLTIVKVLQGVLTYSTSPASYVYTEIPATDIAPPSGTPSESSYYVDYNTGLIYFYSTTQGGGSGGGSNLKYTYEYSYNLLSAEIVTLNGGSTTGSVSKIDSTTGANSVTKNGLYARKLSVPRITSANSATDIGTFAANFITANKGDSNDNIQSRYEVKTPSFIGHLLENNTIDIYYIKKGIGSVVNGDIDPVALQIKSIEYRYPDSQTKLEIGEFLYDSFDLENNTTELLRSTQSNQF